MRIATWNVNSLRVRLEHVKRWAEQARPDVICLQETKVEDDKFPTEELAALGFEHQAFIGEKTYNGVAILSKQPLDDVQKGLSDDTEDPQPRFIAATTGGVRVLCCYVPMGTKIGSKQFSYKLAWLSRLKREVRAALAQTEQVVVVGDMNVALEDLDVWDPFEADGKILFHPAERDALKRVLSTGLVDAYRQAHPDGNEYSWWDYRGGAWWKNHGFRIDHVLVSKALASAIHDVTIWKDTRGWEEPSKPSDHVPVTVDLEA